MSPTRLHRLDGLRGLAILAVVFTHLPNTKLYDALPIAIHPFFNVITNNGTTGVYMLFILTGFLMAWLYPLPKSHIRFWSRRYARLLPAFLVMVTTFTTINIVSPTSPIYKLLILFSIALIVRGIWEICQKVPSTYNLAIWLTSGWIALQVTVILGYMLLQARVPSPVFYQVWDKNTQWLITGLVNATLTLPFGRYIGQLDGVYWTLVIETAFYLLYPILFVPIFQKIKSTQCSTYLKIGLFASVFPFLFGMYLTSQRILGFDMIFVYLTIYFIVGIIIAFYREQFEKKLERLPKLFLGIPGFVCILLVILTTTFAYELIPKFYHPWIQMCLVFPIGLLLVVLLHPKQYWLGFFEQKWLIMLGKYSYSLYLTHAICIQVVKSYISPDTAQTTLVLMALSLGLSILVSVALFHLVEKPYFNVPKLSHVSIHRSYSIWFWKLPSIVSSHIIVPTLIIVVFFICYIAYRPFVSLFTYTRRHTTNNVFSYVTTKAEQALSVAPTQFRFTGQEDMLGMITMHIHNRPTYDIGGDDTQIHIRLRNENQQIISQTIYKAADIIENRYHAFGFPRQSDSKNNKYTLEYQLLPHNISNNIYLITDEGNFVTVYFADKSVLLSHPIKLFDWGIKKFIEPFTNPMFWISVGFSAPFLLLLFTLTLVTKKEITS